MSIHFRASVGETKKCAKTDDFYADVWGQKADPLIAEKCDTGFGRSREMRANLPPTQSILFPDPKR